MAQTQQLSDGRQWNGLAYVHDRPVNGCSCGSCAHWFPRIHDKLTHAVTEYDRKQAAKRGYNRYALAMYLGAVQNAMEAVERGEGVRAAIVAAFNGQLLDVCLKAIGESPATREELR